MTVNQILKELKYYTGELPKDAINEALNKKEEITPKLLEWLDYLEENMDAILKGNDDFYGYMYAFYILGALREQKAFPYLIRLTKKDDKVMEELMGEDFVTEYLPRLLASTYNGDDESLYEIIEDDLLDEYVTSSVLHIFPILYLYGIKDREFLIDYLRKITNSKKVYKPEIYDEAISEIVDLKLTELEDELKILIVKLNDEDFYDNKDAIKELNNGEEVDMHKFPIMPTYLLIDNVVGIMDQWAEFCYIEDEEFENSDEAKIYEYSVFKREDEYNDTVKGIGRNDPCFCGSGKKYKNCCMKSYRDDVDSLNLIDGEVIKAEWFSGRNEKIKAYIYYRHAIFNVMMFCRSHEIKTIDEFDETYNLYDCFSNFYQDFDQYLEENGDARGMYDRLDIFDEMELTFDLDLESELYWKKFVVRNRANAEYQLDHMKKATKIIEDYLKVNPTWTWGYVEMADWYFYNDSKYYDLKKAESILLRAEKEHLKTRFDDMDAIYERLKDLYDKLGDSEKTKLYDKKYDEYVNEQRQFDIDLDTENMKMLDDWMKEIKKNLNKK